MREYYRPTDHGAEAALADRLQRIEELLGSRTASTESRG